jgi:hypothetical protein
MLSVRFRIACPDRADQGSTPPPTVIRSRPALYQCIADPSGAPGRAGQEHCKRVDVPPRGQPPRQFHHQPLVEQLHRFSMSRDQLVRDESILRVQLESERDDLFPRGPPKALRVFAAYGALGLCRLIGKRPNPRSDFASETHAGVEKISVAFVPPKPKEFDST